MLIKWIKRFTAV